MIGVLNCRIVVWRFEVERANQSWYRHSNEGHDHEHKIANCTTEFARAILVSYNAGPQSSIRHCVDSSSIILVDTTYIDHYISDYTCIGINTGKHRQHSHIWWLTMCFHILIQNILICIVWGSVTVLTISVDIVSVVCTCSYRYIQTLHYCTVSVNYTGVLQL